jgi:low affinity Fe/Cu permease
MVATLALREARGGSRAGASGQNQEMKPGRTSSMSRVLHGVDSWTSKAWAAAVLSAASLVTLVVSIVLGSDHALTLMAAVVQVVTLVMVFVIQHTQSRDQRITHRKLDELLHATPDADARMVMLERASDDEIDEASRRHLHHSPHG